MTDFNEAIKNAKEAWLIYYQNIGLTKDFADIMANEMVDRIKEYSKKRM
jgi:hypothetical protein